MQLQTAVQLQFNLFQYILLRNFKFFLGLFIEWNILNVVLQKNVVSESIVSEVSIGFLGLQVSISPTFYAQLLHAQIPKVQKYSQFKQLFVLLGSVRVKAVGNYVDEFDPRFPNQIGCFANPITATTDSSMRSRISSKRTDF